MRRPLAWWVLTIYFVAVLAALGAAAMRLRESIEMPGLAAIELVLLALPWSLALGIEPMSRVGLAGMGAVVLGGLLLNAFILTRVAARLQRQITKSA